MQKVMRSSLWAACLVLVGCAIQVDLPQEFLVLSRSSTMLRATTADDTIFWVERFDLPDQGSDLAFWVAALKEDFVGNRGYTLLEEEPFETERGIQGQQLQFEATVEGQPCRYLVALLVTEGGALSSPQAFVARMTADKARYQNHVDAVTTALRTLR